MKLLCKTMFPSEVFASYLRLNHASSDLIGLLIINCKLTHFMLLTFF